MTKEIDNLHRILSKTTDPASEYVLLLNPMEKNGGLADYLENKKWIVGKGTVIALDSIKKILVRNGHYVLIVPSGEFNDIGEEKDSFHHLYVMTPADPTTI